MEKSMIDKAAQFCKENGYRYTEPRERVLKILLAKKKPLGAYDILAELAKEMDNPKPPTIYRAIQFWQEHGFIHCIESLKSYVACSCHHQDDGAQFLICQKCGEIKELESHSNKPLLLAQVNQYGFNLDNWTTEIKGECHNCSQKQE
ncbi:MAG: transcriptional repressor [Legionellaceae bacterium]|nr:transcriptional repressor [Legionellaceae bacterium]